MAAVHHGATIWAGALVTDREQVPNGWEPTTPEGTLRARQVIPATDGSPNFGWFRRRIIPIASFIVATGPV